MRLSARIATVELTETFVISRSAQVSAEVVFIELEHDGVTGYGEATPIARYDQSAESALAYIEAHGDELGDDPWALEEIEGRLPRVAPARAAARRAADVLDDLARRPGRHGAAHGGRRGTVQAAEAEARRSRRARRRARARGARRDGSAAD